MYFQLLLYMWWCMYGFWQLPNLLSFTWGLNPGAKDEFWSHLALEGEGQGWWLTQLLLHRQWVPK